MIQSFRHKGLKRLFESGDRRKARLDQASKVRDMNLPGFRLHPLKGDLAGYWSVMVSGNWRVVFRLENGQASDVDLIDYH